jgi:hypothetical protein
MWAWLVYWLGPIPERVNLQVTAAAQVSATASLTVARPNETDLERVQRDIQELRERLGHLETNIQGRLATVEQSLHEKHELLTTRVDEIETRQREARRADLRQTRWAGRLFALGAVLSAAGGIV